MKDKSDVIKTAIAEAKKRASLCEDVVKGYSSELAHLCVENGEDRIGAADVWMRDYAECDITDYADFCKTFAKDSADSADTLFEGADDAADVIVIPDIGVLRNVAEKLTELGIVKSVQIGEGFSSCAEDVLFARGDCTLLPVYDKDGFRLSAFNTLREKYGLKICTRIITSNDGAFDLCSLSYCRRGSGRLLLAFEGDAESPIEIMRGLAHIGFEVSYSLTDSTHMYAEITTDADAEHDVSAAVMFLSIMRDVSFSGLASVINL